MARYYGRDPGEFSIDEWLVLWERVNLYENAVRPKSTLEMLQELAATVAASQREARERRIARGDASKSGELMIASFLKTLRGER